MAKWGEGDPRWIVEDRPDATNVNNWHWTEKNATGWSTDKLKNLLVGLKIEDDEASCEIKELTTIEGEASASNRKGKLVFFYEWDIKAEWSGLLSGKDKKIKGKLNIPNLSDENTADEIDVNVEITDKTDEAYKLKEFMRLKGTTAIREQVAKYIGDLKVEFSQGMILPTKDSAGTSKPKSDVKNTAKTELNKPVNGSPTKQNSLGVSIRTKKFTSKEEFKCQAHELYRALTEKGMVQAFTRGPVEMEVEKGGPFCLFGGMVRGRFTDLKLNEKICMEWRFKSWPEEHYSNVTLEFKEQSDCTELIITQTEIPEQDYDRTQEGWKRYYWESIRQTFGFGVRLF